MYFFDQLFFLCFDNLIDFKQLIFVQECKLNDFSYKQNNLPLFLSRSLAQMEVKKANHSPPPPPPPLSSHLLCPLPSSPQLFNCACFCLSLSATATFRIKRRKEEAFCAQFSLKFPFFNPFVNFTGQFDHSGMEKEASCGANWHSTGAMPRPDLGPGSATDQLPQCFFSLNGKQPLSHDPDLESALSSLVSSPSSHLASAANGAVIGELIGRLGTICNSGEILPPAHHRNANTSCYSTPLNSPPNLNLSVMDYRQHGRRGFPMPVSPMPGAYSVPFSAGQWFAEAASRDPRIGGMLSGVSINESTKACSGSRIVAPEIGGEVGTLTAAQLEMEIGDGQEESSVSDRITVTASSVRGITDGNGRKRKAAAKGKAKATPLSYSATYPSNV